jgi:hypothetical protein
MMRIQGLWKNRAGEIGSREREYDSINDNCYFYNWVDYLIYIGSTKTTKDKYIIHIELMVIILSF